MNLTQPLVPVTPEQVNEYFEAYKGAIPPEDDAFELVVKTFTRPRLPFEGNLFAVTVQMHILGVPADKVESDTEKLATLHSVLASNCDELQKTWERHPPRPMSWPESAALAVNNIINFINRYPEKFATV